MKKSKAHQNRRWAMIPAAMLFLAMAVPAECRDAGPRLVLPRTVIDLGVSFQGEKATGSFLIRNDGAAPLNIREIKPSCGCTVADLEKNTVIPGGEVKVGIAIDTSGKTGKVKKNVVIRTDDPGNPEATVDILTEVRIKEHMSWKKDRTLFTGDCARCHAAPAQGKTGEPLFEAVCAMCHGHYGLGGSAPRINGLKFLEAHDDAYVKKIITGGKHGTSMPGFSKEYGGPLDETQVDSIVGLIRWWENGFVFKSNEERHKHVNRVR